MIVRVTDRHALAITLAVAVATVLTACGSKEPSAPADGPPTATPHPPHLRPRNSRRQRPPRRRRAWSPEALEELLAPIALYPDPVLSQVLIASTNPRKYSMRATG